MGFFILFCGGVSLVCGSIILLILVCEDDDDYDDTRGRCSCGSDFRPPYDK